MAERVIKEYRRLFEIRILHHYWLDEGRTIFDQLTTERREKHLLAYDLRSFLAVKPTASTSRIFQGLGCVYKNTSMGCMVAIPKDSVVSKYTLFEFLVTIQDPAFYNYTSLMLRSQKISEFYDHPGRKTYRYKENVAVLSNLTGTIRGTGQDKSLFLSTEFPAVDDGRVESLYVSGNVLFQLTGDKSASKQKLYDEAADLPVFVHQFDVPFTVPPAGLVGVPPRGVMLSDDISDDVHVLIRLSAGVSGVFSFIDDGGYAKENNPVFQVRFKNRSTFWKYINKKIGDWISPDPLPLTYYGNAGTKQKPSQGTVKPMTDSSGKITQIVSEIYT